MGPPFIRRAQRINFQPDMRGQAQLLEQITDHKNHFSIDVRPGHAEGFSTELRELTQPSLLRAFIAKHRALIPQALGFVVTQIIFQYRTHTAAGPLGPQRNLFAAFIRKVVHFFGNDICGFANSTFE